MQTRLADFIRDTPDGRTADTILRKCVHCGFCTATCPTYQLLGDELDGPRGRIYLVKQLLEGAQVTARTQLHLDRCLTCRACETTCPSGVRYGRLADIGRRLVAERVPRPFNRAPEAQRPARGHPASCAIRNRCSRWADSRDRCFPASSRARCRGESRPAAGPRRGTHDECLRWAAACRARSRPASTRRRRGSWTGWASATCRRRTPAAAGRRATTWAPTTEALAMMRRNIDAWWPEIEAGAEAIAVTASACAAEVKEYAELLGARSGLRRKGRTRIVARAGT